MNATTVKALAASRGLNQSDIARLAGVSRQRVSQWFRSTATGAPVNLRSMNLKALADGLKVSTDELFTPLPLLDEPEKARLETAKLLWDRLYPDLVSFAIDAGRGRSRALARLVQVYGLYAAARMAGRSVWTNFPKYSKHIHPVRRKELEVLWKLRMSPTKA
jgi:transcriptional regulator with XRE-family HTH domain